MWLSLLLWSVIGVLSGWVGFLASRSHKTKRAQPYLLVGAGGGLVGGTSAEALGLSETAASPLDPVSAFNALLFSGLFIILYIGIVLLLRKTESK